MTGSTGYVGMIIAACIVYPPLIFVFVVMGVVYLLGRKRADRAAVMRSINKTRQAIDQ